MGRQLFHCKRKQSLSWKTYCSIETRSQPFSVKYDPYTKTAFLINVDYYGWIKSIALAVAGDILEDEHRIYSVHGAMIEVDRYGVSIIAPSGTGKTTHSWGLLRNPTARLISDDWYFVRLSSREPLAFGSEKNSYIEADIGKIWNEYERLVDKALFDQRGRAVVNVRWIVGNGGVIPMATMHKIILLKRDPSDQNIVTPLDANDAVQYFAGPQLLQPTSTGKGQKKNRGKNKILPKTLRANRRLPREHDCKSTRNPRGNQKSSFFEKIGSLMQKIIEAKRASLTLTRHII